METYQEMWKKATVASREELTKSLRTIDKLIEIINQKQGMLLKQLVGPEIKIGPHQASKVVTATIALHTSQKYPVVPEDIRAAFLSLAGEINACGVVTSLQIGFQCHLSNKVGELDKLANYEDPMMEIVVSI